MNSKLLTHGFNGMDIVRKGHNDVNVNEKVKNKFVCKGIDQLDNNEKDWRDSLPQNAENFYKKESSTSLVYRQTDELNESHSAGLAFDSSSGKEVSLFYLEKTYAYMQNLHMVGMFTFLGEESLPFPNEESWVLSDKKRSAPLEPECDIKKYMCCFTCLHSFLFGSFRYFLCAIYH